MTKKVLNVFGTRPEAIKMAPVVRAFEGDLRFTSSVCVSGQHREMLDQALDFFQIVPEYDLNVMAKGQDLYDVTSAVLLGLRDVLREARPEVVLVHGDTTTTFAATLAAFYEKIPVGHVEAGLRTGNLFSPWPEEANRILTTRLASYHFAPTSTASDALVREGVDPACVYVTGNTVIDALMWVRKKILGTSSLYQALHRALPYDGKEKMVLITGHRRESFGHGFEKICTAVSQAAADYPDVHFVYPVHLNPKVQEPVKRILGGKPNVHLLPPQGYVEFVWLMMNSELILTDSGGIQEEAPALGKPVLLMRESTERPEALSTGAVTLVGTNPEKIQKTIEFHLGQGRDKQAVGESPFGDGRAAQRIVQALANIL